MKASAYINPRHVPLAFVGGVCFIIIHLQGAFAATTGSSRDDGDERAPTTTTTASEGAAFNEDNNNDDVRRSAITTTTRQRQRQQRDDYPIPVLRDERCPWLSDGVLRGGTSRMRRSRVANPQGPGSWSGGGTRVTSSVESEEPTHDDGDKKATTKTTTTTTKKRTSDGGAGHGREPRRKFGYEGMIVLTAVVVMFFLHGFIAGISTKSKTKKNRF